MMEWLAESSFATFLVVLLGIVGAVAAIGKAIDVVKGWFSPASKLKERVEAHDHMLDRDKKRLDSFEEQVEDLKEGQRTLCRAMKALLSHEVNGENVAGLKEAQADLDEYLISK